jgi:hypothetical protein
MHLIFIGSLLPDRVAAAIRIRATPSVDDERHATAI